MAISTKGDFSLKDYRPTDGFGSIRHPKSFRACLQQVVQQLQNLSINRILKLVLKELRNFNL